MKENTLPMNLQSTLGSLLETVSFRGENLKVETNEQDMKVFINPGYAWIEGFI